jgi:hypothetical protein
VIDIGHATVALCELDLKVTGLIARSRLRRALPGKASPAEVAQYGQDNDDNDDDPKQGHVDLLFVGDGMTLRLVTRVALGQNFESALRAGEGSDH